MNKSLILSTALIQLLTASRGWTQTTSAATKSSIEQTAGYTEVDYEKAEVEARETWLKYITEKLKDSKINVSASIPLIEFGSGTSLKGRYQNKSVPSVANLYSGIDIWSLDFDTDYFPKSSAAITSNFKREVTFIQQFNSRMAAIKRLPYNPYTKIPNTAERAKNLAISDYFAFRAPLTVAIGNRIDDVVDDTTLKSLPIISAFISSEMDVQIFKMENNHVRVRAIALSEKGAKASFELILITPHLIINRLFKVNPLEIEASNNHAKSLTFDYIFDLNDTDAARAYEQLVGQRLNVKEIVKSLVGVPTSNAKLLAELKKELEAANDLAAADENKDLASRRVIRLAKIQNESSQDSFSIGTNILRLVKFTALNRTSESNITLFDIKDGQQDYFVKTFTEERKRRIFNWKGNRNILRNSGIIVSKNGSKEMNDIIGLHTIILNDNINVTQGDLKALADRLSRILPKEVASTLSIPNAKNLSGEELRNAHVTQSLSFNADALENLKTITYHNIKTELELLMDQMGDIDIRPMGDVSEANEKSARLQYLVDRNYKMAYSHELHYIPLYLATVLNKNERIETRMESYDKLANLDLYKELGAALLMRLIPVSKLKESFSFKLEISGRYLERVYTSTYPANADLTKHNLFNRILQENDYVNDRSQNLRMFLRDDGAPFSSKELLVRFKSVSK